ncbi:hypothetical protein Cgig2_000850 [Carnegiea gigantea]|uniref:Dof zinc finger protein n=1 Tax=Carnegiea gigantea TaxID=171969 RepID=A0A9Q1GRS5_9CARY|nr:hypothetical protein Cgig2_000850 [Carnegiea gigantea]
MQAKRTAECGTKRRVVEDELNNLTDIGEQKTDKPMAVKPTVKLLLQLHHQLNGHCSMATGDDSSKCMFLLAAAATACSNMITNNNKASSTCSERKVRPQKDQALNCPRCNSTNTKFCYYNNYSLTQPRYFCKTCRRYWTEGGSLRNIPVGGGSRKSKSSSSCKSNNSSSSSSSLSASKKLALLHDHHDLALKIHHPGQDLNLGFPPATTHQQFRSLSEFIQLPNIEATAPTMIRIPSSSSTTASTSADHASANHHHPSALQLLNGLPSSRGLTPFMPMSVVYSLSSGLPSLQDFKPTLNFSLDGLGNGFGSLQQQGINNDHNGKLLFPLEDSKQVLSNNASADDQTREQGNSTGYWSGMLGMHVGGSW